MKRSLFYLAAVLLLVAASCSKEKSAGKPSITWESNAKFSEVELTDALDAVVTLNAPDKFQELKLSLDLGDFNPLVNQYISVNGNKYPIASTPVLDLMADEASVSFLRILGMSVGSALSGKESVKLNLKAILEAILSGQPVESSRTFSVGIRVMDQSGQETSKTAKFHITPAPRFSWAKNPRFDVVSLDATAIECKVEIGAPGKIETLTVTLENDCAPFLVTYVRNRTTDGKTVIDLVGDAKVAESFKGYFPSGSAVQGKDQVVLDFSFLYNVKYDLEPSTNVFTIKVTDKNAKEATAQVRFRKD